MQSFLLTEWISVGQTFFSGIDNFFNIGRENMRKTNDNFFFICSTTSRLPAQYHNSFFKFSAWRTHFKRALIQSKKNKIVTMSDLLYLTSCELQISVVLCATLFNGISLGLKYPIAIVQSQTK